MPRKWLFLIVTLIVAGYAVGISWAKSPALLGNSRETPIVQVVKMASPAVVNISTEEIITPQTNPFYTPSFDPFFNDVFREFFNSFPQQGYKRQSLGSGVIIDCRGYILTNDHVIPKKAARIMVNLLDGREFAGQLVGTDPDSDLAVIRIDSKDKLPSIVMGSSNDIMVGETVIAIGNPFGLNHTVTTGVVSAVDRSIKIDESRVYHDFIQTDASINPGNSGGPLLNVEGKLIGVNSAIYQKAEGIGFAIPIDKAKRIMDDLIQFGVVHKAWLGIFVRNLDSAVGKHFRQQTVTGVVVTGVVVNSPASEAKIKPGDIIVKIHGKKVTSKRDYEARISSFTANDRLSFEVLRKQQQLTISLKAAEIPIAEALDIAHEWLGIKVAKISVASRLFYNLETTKGALVLEVSPGSSAQRIGIGSGDVIRQLESQIINSLEDFKKAVVMAMQKERLLLLVQRGRYGYYVTLQP